MAISSVLHGASRQVEAGKVLGRKRMAAWVLCEQLAGLTSHTKMPSRCPHPLARSAWLVWGAIQCSALLAERALQVLLGISR